MPQIKESFTVQQPVATVWGFFQDVPEVATCMPGVELLESGAGNTYQGKMKVKLGPIRATFEGEATIEDLSEAELAGTISAKGADRQGGSRASARVRYSLAQLGRETKVDIVADVTLQGAMAQFGRTGLLQEVSSELTKEFAACIEKKLGAISPEEAAAIQAGEVRGIRIFFRGLWNWAKRLFRRQAGD